MIREPAQFLAGVDDLSLDQRDFDPSRDDIERVCRFFDIGKLRHFKKEKGITISHSNFFVFAATAKGLYALKFYPPDTAKTIAVEYAVNRTLIKHHFPTPLMYAGRGGQPFWAVNNRLVACFAYIDGKQAWQGISQQNTIRLINTALLSIKNILSAGSKPVPLHQQADLLSRAGSLAKISRGMAVYEQKEMIEGSLREACRAYQLHRPLFTRQRLHNNASLTNFLIYKKEVFTLDLSHVREDYALCDLASLVISCLFFKTSAMTVRAVSKDYFTRHQIKPEYAAVLNTLVKIGLITEYLKNVQREKSLDPSSYPPGLVRAYSNLLSKRKKSIVTVLKKMIENPGLLV